MKNRRKRYIIDKRLQYRLLIYNGIYLLVIILAIGAGLVLPLALELSNPNLSRRPAGGGGEQNPLPSFKAESRYSCSFS